MELMISGRPAELVISPANELEEVAQNVRMILLTPKGSVPLDRDFGLSFTVLDQPAPRAQALLASEIVTQVARYEPRAQVVQVDWEPLSPEAAEGRLVPRVRIEAKP